MVKGSKRFDEDEDIKDEKVENVDESSLIIDVVWDFFPLDEFKKFKKLPIDKAKVINIDGQSGVPKLDPSGIVTKIQQEHSLCAP